jgi:hypothetical protein
MPPDIQAVSISKTEFLGQPSEDGSSDHDVAKICAETFAADYKSGFKTADFLIFSIRPAISYAASSGI